MTAKKALVLVGLTALVGSASCVIGPSGPVARNGAATPAPPRPVHLNRAYVATGSGVIPIDLATGAPGDPIPTPAGTVPVDIVIASDGMTAYVAAVPPTDSHASAALIPLSLLTNTFGSPIPIATTKTFGVILAPGGKTAYIIAFLSDRGGAVIPLDLTTDVLGSPILTPTGTFPASLDITPDGKTAYVAVDALAAGSINAVIPIDLTTRTFGPAIPSPPGTYPVSIAIAPDGKSAYVADAAPRNTAVGGNGTANSAVIPIDLSTNSPGRKIGNSSGSDLSNNAFNATFVIVAPDGKTAYVGERDYRGFATELIPVDLTTTTPQIRPRSPDAVTVSIGGDINSIAIAHDSRMAYMAVHQNPDASGTAAVVPDIVVPIDLATFRMQTPIALNSTALAIDVTP